MIDILLSAVFPLILLFIEKNTTDADRPFDSLIFFIVACIVFRIVLRLKNGKPQNTIRRSAFSYTGAVFISAAICFLYSFAVIAMMEAENASSRILTVLENPAAAIIDGASGRYIISFLAVTPIAEELSFRGLQKSLKEHCGGWQSVLISIVAYAFFKFLLYDKAGLIFGFASGTALALLFDIYNNYAASAAGSFGCGAGILLAYIGVILTDESLKTFALAALVLSILLVFLAWLGEKQSRDYFKAQQSS